MDAVIEAFGEEDVLRFMEESNWITLSGVFIANLSHAELLVIIAAQLGQMKEGNRKAREEWIPALKKMGENLDKIDAIRRK